MKNFMNKNYKNYYIQSTDGETMEVTKMECFMPGEKPTEDNPFKQRWHFDVEAGYVVRLPRNEKGEQLYRVNYVTVRKEERHHARKYACVGKGTGGCDSDCTNCQKKRTTRTIDLDKPLYGNRGGEDVFLEIAGPDAFITYENKEMLKSLISKLTVNEQKLICLYYYEEKNLNEIGVIFGITHQAVNKQLKKVLAVLKKF